MTSADISSLSDDDRFELLAERLSRQTLLKELGENGARRIVNAHFLVIGAGGVGSPALMYLASAGASHITIVDHDTVATNNLSRQLLHHEDGLGQNKAHNAARELTKFNPQIQVQVVDQQIQTLDQLLPLLQQADVVLDCTDNLLARHLINQAAFLAKKPLVFGSCIRFSGQVATFDFRKADSPCLHCIFEEDAASNDEKASTYGVFSPLTGLIGTLQAIEALKIVAQLGQPLTNQLLLVDLLTMSFQKLKIQKNTGCPVCNTTA